GNSSGKTSDVIKDFVIDYNSYAEENLMEYELFDEGLTYRYVYGVDKLGVTAYTIPNGSASVTTAEGDLPLYYHMDHMGSSEFLTSDVTQRITSWTSYDEWGNITHNAVLKCGERELDLVKTYTGHERDSVLGMYYAKARMYDTADKHGSTKANKLGDKRFTAVDPVKGDARNPQTMVQYTYVINNPLMYVDPLGLFAQGDILELGSGTSIFDGQTETDVAWLQLRLLSKGYLTINNITSSWGKIDSTTLAAINSYKDNVGLSNDGIYKGKVGATTWAHLGLEFGEIDPTSRFEMRTRVADEMLNIILDKQQEPIILDTPNGAVYGSYVLRNYTYWGKYYQKFECAVNSQLRAKALGEIADFGASVGGNYFILMETIPILSTVPYATGAGALGLTLFEEMIMNGFKTDSSDDVDRYLPEVLPSDFIERYIEVLAVPKVEKTLDDLYAITNSSAKGILLRTETLSSAPIIINVYLGQLATILPSLDNDEKAYIESLMFVNHEQMSMQKYVKEVLKNS
ncbi:MAG: RHS repeat-associated core domain-containing protein, partial [Lachnospiraceae bacterium]|nr:RHS repeat-associated core domain-containing protein [Lachnospiraceae bacterium]